MAVEIIGVAPSGRPVPRLAVAVARAGGTGVLDLGADRAPGLAALADVRRWWTGPFGVRVPPGCGVRPAELPSGAGTVVAAAAALLSGDWVDIVGFTRGRRLLVEAADPAEAVAAVRVGLGLTDEVGVVARGCDGGGHGELTTFVLLQRLLADLDVPVYAAGGIGPHTAAAAVAGGAAGVVLDEQLALVREMDLSGLDPARPGPPDATLAGRYKTAGGVVQAVRAQIAVHIGAAVRAEPLAPRTDPAVVQGPMAQVSDGSAFAGAVAQDGGLPFLALGPLDGGRARALLRETADRLGGRPWGAGVLGAAPPELRAEQLAAVRDARPPYAIIAAGGQAEAAPLEAAGIAAYLHVTTPEQLGRFLAEGARKFVLAGSECGGHVGPHASFPLWDAQVGRLMAFTGDDAGELSLMFAGGVHDARSAAMVAALAGPLAERGADVRVLMGTAYLFTSEAVAAGAIVPGYQDVALACDGTALLETAPGHAARCARTPYVATFEETRRELEQAGTPEPEVRRRLEKLNAGRLLVASRGVRLDTPVDAVRQRSEGMFAMGQVAALRSATTGIAALHEEVTSGATAFLAARAAELGIGAPSAGRDAARPADIAIVGIACAFPGARDADGYWANIVGGVDSTAGRIPDIPFDADAYGFPADALGGLDPLRLLSLEISARALQDAGYADRPFDRSRTSVFFAAGAEPPAGLIADRLNLGGTVCTVGPPSLAALDISCKDLVAGSSSTVLSGSADLRGGVACVVLKRLADAERDGDRIYAVVKSVAGARGPLAVDRAHERAGVAPSSVELVEADRHNGLGGLIKTAYALHTGVRVDGGARPWAVRPGERLAGVSGGADAGFHAVLSGYEGAPEPVSGLAEWPAELFLIRADDRAAARAEISRLERLAEADPRLRDLARTAAALDGPVQVAFVATGLDDLRAKLAHAALFRPAPGVFVAGGEPGQVAFLFPGEGERPGALADLFVAFPRLQRLLRPAGGRYAGVAGLAVHRLLTAVGVHPDLAAGHGHGELTALCAAGVIDDTDMIEIGAACAGAVPSRADLLSPAFPVWASTTARPYETEPSDLAAAPAAPVHAAEQIEAMYEAGARTFVEAGPGRALADLVGTTLGDRPHTAVSCAVPGENGLVALLRTLAELAAGGVPVEPLPLFAGRGARPLAGTPAGPRLLVNGHRVRTAGSGQESVRPAEAAVLEYLRTSREIIAAQREVVLRHLAAPVPARVPEPVPAAVPAARPDPPAPRASAPPPIRISAHVRTAALSGGPAEPPERPVPRMRRGADTQVWPRPEPRAARPVRRVPRIVDLDPLPAPPESGAAFDGRRFLIVDDGCGIALELGDLLGRHGAQVRTPPDADGPCDGLVHLAALRPGAAGVLPQAFGGIRRALEGGPRWLVLASGAGGTFGSGFRGGVVGDPAPGAGLRGLARTLAAEYPEALVRALDLDTRDTPRAIARRIMAELLAPGAPAAVGHEGARRRGLELRPAEPDGDGPLDLGRDAVVLLTGAEHAITARTALELARTTGCRIELMGREPEHDLDALREHAADVRYHAGDARDPQAVRKAVENVQLTHRRLDGVIHNTALDEHEPVPETAYRTRVDATCALVRAVQPDLGFLTVLCGPAGADGDRGRAGDAAADDACATLAHVWRRRLRGRVLVAGLGPALDPDAAAAALLREIAHGDGTHVVLTGGAR